MNTESVPDKVVALCALPMLALGQNTGKNSVQKSNQVKQEEQFQIRQQNFTSGRQLLLNKGVPFNPDDLLRDDWATHLKPASGCTAGDASVAL